MLGTIVTGAIQTVAGLKAQQSGELEGDEIQEYFKDHAEDFNATMGMECLSMVTEGLLIYGMDLFKASLRQACLHGARLDRANLFSADLDQVAWPGASLSGANYQRTRLSLLATLGRSA